MNRLLIKLISTTIVAGHAQFTGDHPNFANGLSLMNLQHLHADEKYSKGGATPIELQE